MSCGNGDGGDGNQSCLHGREVHFRECVVVAAPSIDSDEDNGIVVSRHCLLNEVERLVGDTAGIYRRAPHKELPVGDGPPVGSLVG